MTYRESERFTGAIMQVFVGEFAARFKSVRSATRAQVCRVRRVAEAQERMECDQRTGMSKSKCRRGSRADEVLPAHRYVEFKVEIELRELRADVMLPEHRYVECSMQVEYGERVRTWMERCEDEEEKRKRRRAGRKLKSSWS